VHDDVEHLGLSTVNCAQVVETQEIAPVVCVQNHDNVAHRENDALIDWFLDQGIARVPTSHSVASHLWGRRSSRPTPTASATPMQVALAAPEAIGT